MNVGDLIKDNEYGDIGLIVRIDPKRVTSFSANCTEPYLIWCDGKLEWHEWTYIEEDCEVLSEAR